MIERNSDCGYGATQGEDFKKTNNNANDLHYQHKICRSRCGVAAINAQDLCRIRVESGTPLHLPGSWQAICRSDQQKKIKQKNSKTTTMNCRHSNQLKTRTRSVRYAPRSQLECRPDAAGAAVTHAYARLRAPLPARRNCNRHRYGRKVLSRIARSCGTPKIALPGHP